MGIIKALDIKLAIKMRSVYGKLFHPSQPQYTLNCEKDKDTIQRLIYELILGATPNGSPYGANRN